MVEYKFLLSIVSLCFGDVMNIRPTYVSLKLTNGDRNVILDSSRPNMHTVLLLPCPIFLSLPHRAADTHIHCIQVHSLSSLFDICDAVLKHSTVYKVSLLFIFFFTCCFLLLRYNKKKAFRLRSKLCYEIKKETQFKKYAS